MVPIADNLNGSIRRLTKPARSRLLKTLSRTQVLILDNFGLSILNAAEGLDLLEIIEDRHGRASTIVTSQVPVDSWLQVIADPTLGDATLDRLVHNAHRLQLTGESMRKKAAKAAILDETVTASTDEYVGQWVPAIP